MLRFNSFCGALGAALLLASLASAENWPEFRGPTGQGLSAAENLPLEWSPTQNVRWKQAIPGKGWSSPIFVEGRIYLTIAIPQGAAGDQSLSALCLDAATGKILWQTEVRRQQARTAPRIHNKNSHASPTPIFAGGRLYVHFGHMGTACLNAEGKILWKQTELGYRPVHGNGGSPLLLNDRLIFSMDGAAKQFVVALSAKTGEVLWKTKREVDQLKKFAFCTPLAITVKGKRQVISPGAGAVGAYDPATGEEIWKVRYEEGYSLIPRPVYGQGFVFVCTGYDRPSLLAIRPDGQGDVTDTHVAWQTDRGVPHSASPLLVETELYLVSDRGIASCRDAKTGKVHWQQRLEGNYSASPLYADGKIYFQNEQGVGTVIAAGKTFRKLASNDLQARTLASYAVADGALFIRTEKEIYRIEESAE